MNDLMFMVTVMETYHWTYKDYEETPAHVLTLIREKMVRDNKEKEMQAKRLRRGR